MVQVFQKDRQYSLQVGNKAKGVEITSLNVSFSVSKSSDNKKYPNKAQVQIYNLSKDNQTWLETPFIEVVLSVGYAKTGMHRLFAGQATIVGTKKSGTDTVTTIELESLYSNMNFKAVSRTSPPGTKVKDIINSMKGDLDGVSLIVTSGSGVERGVVDGYPMFGSPRQILNELSDAYQLEWQIDDDTLYVMDLASSYTNNEGKAFVISETSGLIERPFFENIEKQRSDKDKARKARKGLRLKTLLNPALVAGSIIKIEYADLTGYYKIERLTHQGEYFGDEWSTDIFCGTRIGGV